MGKNDTAKHAEIEIRKGLASLFMDLRLLEGLETPPLPKKSKHAK